MSCEKPRLLFPFLSACLYGEASHFYRGLKESERDVLETQVKSFGLSAWFYRYLHDVLSDEKRKAFQKAYHANKIQAIIAERELNRLCDILRKRGLRFALIKGADLAYRLYPDSALRCYADWDIWFHPDDCERALEALSEDGWRTPSVYTGKRGATMKTGAHHFSPVIRGGYKVEPHFTLPHFNDIDPHEMWEYTTECPEGEQHVLSPELNLLMLTRHASGQAYFHANIPRLLTDVSVIIMHEKVDFVKLRAMADKWKLPYSGNLLAAFPEFFPADVISEFHADSTETVKFKTLFEKRISLGTPQCVPLFLNQLFVRGTVIQGLWDYLCKCGPEKMRVLYHLPKQCAWPRVAWTFIQYYCTRTWRMICLLVRPDKALLDYCIMVESIESNTGSGRKM